MTVYLNDKCKPLVQVTTDGLQNQQLRGGLVQGEILSIGPRVTWEESVMALMLETKQTNIMLLLKEKAKLNCDKEL